MAAASRILASSLGPDGKQATLTLNYDDVSLNVTSIVINNGSAAECNVHVVNRGGNTVFDQAYPTGVTTLNLNSVNVKLTSNLTFPNGWEIGLGF